LLTTITKTTAKPITVFALTAADYTNRCYLNGSTDFKYRIYSNITRTRI